MEERIGSYLKSIWATYDKILVSQYLHILYPLRNIIRNPDYEKYSTIISQFILSFTSNKSVPIRDEKTYLVWLFIDLTVPELNQLLRFWKKCDFKENYA